MWRALFDAMRYGKELADAAYWKNVQLAANTLSSLIGALLLLARGAGADVALDSEAAAVIAYGVVCFYGVANSVLVVATTRRLGIGKL